MTRDSLSTACLSNSFPANPTQQIPHQEAYTAQSAFSSLLYPSLSTFETSSSILTTHSLQLKSLLLAVGDIPLRPPTTLTTLDESRKSKSAAMLYSNNMTSSLLNPSATSIPAPSCLPKHPRDELPPSFPCKPRPYKPNLTPIPSSLRPHCLARQRLLQWIPSRISPRADLSSRGIPLTNEDLNCILRVISASWEDSTKELYGTGLLVYHVYCDVNNIPDEQRALISPNLLAAFLSNYAGSVSGTTVSNYTTALKAWHILHGLQWNIEDAEPRALLKGAHKLTPLSTKRPK